MEITKIRTDGRTDEETLGPDPAPPTRAQEEICAVRSFVRPDFSDFHYFLPYKHQGFFIKKLWIFKISTFLPRKM